MRTISIQMSDMEYNAFGLSKDVFYFSEIANLVERQVARQALRRSVELAEKYGLSAMTMDEISAEVNAVRTCKA